MWNANALLMVNAGHVAHGGLNAVVAVVLVVAARSGLGSHARDTLTFFVSPEAIYNKVTVDKDGCQKKYADR